LLYTIVYPTTADFKKEVFVFGGSIHVAIALFLYLSMFSPDIPNIIGLLLGSLLPDIDTPHSTLGKYNLLSYFMSHRGFTHTLLGLAIFSFLVYGIFPNISKGFIFGYYLHLLMDFLTPQGIMWLYPFSKKYFSVWKRKSKTF